MGEEKKKEFLDEVIKFKNEMIKKYDPAVVSSVLIYVGIGVAKQASVHKNVLMSVCEKAWDMFNNNACN